MELFLSALVTLLVIIDPVGTAAMFGAMTAQHTPQQAHAIAKKSSAIAFCILLFFGLFGAVLIKQLGISLEAFRIAGGLLLFVIAFRMLMGHHDQHNIEQKISVYSPRGDQGDIAVFPLAIPLQAGPGCMTAMILLVNQSHEWEKQALVFAAMALTMCATYVSMLGVSRVMQMFGEAGIQIMARLMGVLLAALAIQFIADGVKGLF